ncbi:MAG: cell division protein FtsQ/DivIB [Pseudomonadota bacterium]
MWDNPHLLRAIANLLFGICLLLVLLGVARLALHQPVFALRKLELTSAPQRVSSEQMRQVLKEHVRGNFFTVDLELTRQSFAKLPWVRKVSVRRKFPLGLQMDVEEHVALARWNGTSLVNTQGEIFMARAEETLPAFIGQAETSLQVARMFKELNDVVQPLHQQIVQLSLSPRFAWQAKLDSGLVLELGRESMRQRLEKFVAVYPYSLEANLQIVRHVDLRYRNGFAAFMPGSEV